MNDLYTDLRLAMEALDCEVKNVCPIEKGPCDGDCHQTCKHSRQALTTLNKKYEEPSNE